MFVRFIFLGSLNNLLPILCHFILLPVLTPGPYSVCRSSCGLQAKSLIFLYLALPLRFELCEPPSSFLFYLLLSLLTRLIRIGSCMSLYRMILSNQCRNLHQFHIDHLVHMRDGYCPSQEACQYESSFSSLKWLQHSSSW